MGSAASQASSTLPVVLIVGGGYGGSKLAQQLDASRKARVVLIDRKNYFLHNVAGLRAAVQKGFADNVLIPYDSLMKNGGVFVRGTVITINPDHVVIEAVTNNNSSSEGDAATSTSTSTSTSSSSSSSTPAVTQVTLRFDYLVIATGSSYAFPSKVSVTEAAEAKKMYDVATQQIQQARKVTVVGGGAVGVELATEIAYTYKKDINDGNKSVTLIHSHTQLLNGSRLSAEFHRQAMQKLESKKINVVLNERVDLNQRVSVSAPSTLAAIAGASSHYFFAPAASSADSFSSSAPTAITLTTDKGTNIETDLVLFATGTKVNNRSFTSPASAFRTAVNPDTGRLNVNEFMQVEGYSNVYAIGDCAGGAAKMAYFAGLHADAAGGNILAQINNQAHGTNTPLKPVTLPAYPGSFVSMGPDDGLGQWFNEKGSIIGSFMVVMFKSKELMVGRNWALFGKKKGTSEDVGGSWWSGWFGPSADELQKQKHAAKVQTLSSTMQVGSDEEATRIVKHGFESLPVTIGQDHV